MASPDTEAFLAAPLQHVDTGSASVAYRRFGSGPPLLLVHGWPLSGFTYRRLIPHLARQFTCYAVDLPGAGETRWSAQTDFSFAGQAETLRRLLDALHLDGCHVVAHDTGASIARALALLAGDRLGDLCLIGTEIPGHRPPWIPLFQRLAALPGAVPMFRLSLSSDWFVRSPLGFGNCFVDRGLLGGDFAEHIIRPLREVPARLDGQLRYLRGIDWQFVDGLATAHRSISNSVLLIWGAEDSIFPVERARSMVPQFAACRGLEVVPGAKLLVHEERPEAVAGHVLGALGA